MRLATWILSVAAFVIKDVGVVAPDPSHIR